MDPHTSLELSGAGRAAGLRPRSGGDGTLGALTEWHHHGNRSAETEYLIGLGLSGLRDYGPPDHRPPLGGESR